MNYFQNLVTNDIFKWLFDNGFPGVKVFLNHNREQLYYTLPYDDPNWQYCDAYYKPTYFDVLHWLFKEHKLYIDISSYNDKFLVQIQYLGNTKTKYFGNCWEIGYKCKNIEECIKSAIEYIINNDVLNKIKS